MQVALGVPEEGDGVAFPDADGHGGEPRGRAVQDGLRHHGRAAGHGAGGVVRATGVGFQRVL